MLPRLFTELPGIAILSWTGCGARCRDSGTGFEGLGFRVKGPGDWLSGSRV